MQNIRKTIETEGFAILDNIFNQQELDLTDSIINSTKSISNNFRKTDDLFAIRKLLESIPELKSVILNQNMFKMLEEIMGSGYFISKAIYFDKPMQSNWVVAWHQDLTINVKQKYVTDGYERWANKEGFYSVQPPVKILEDIYTFRIHLDDTDKSNGALKVVKGSHLNGMVKVDENSNLKSQEPVCNVKAGGVMIMKPLLLHASNRSTSNSARRVIHIEFSKAILPEGLEWAEKELIDILV